MNSLIGFFQLKKTFITTDRRDINTKNDTGLSSKISIK